MLTISADQNTLTLDDVEYVAEGSEEYSCAACAFDLNGAKSCVLVERGLRIYGSLCCTPTPRNDGRSIVWIRKS